MPIVVHVKGLSGDIRQNEAGEIGIYLITGQLLPAGEDILREAMEAVADAARIVLALKGLL